MNEQSNFTDQANATMMAMRHRSYTAETKSITQTIINMLLGQESRKRARQKKHKEAFELGVEAIVADLLISATNTSPWCYRSLYRNSFRDEIIGADTFNTIITLMKRCGMLEHAKGGNQSHPFPESAADTPDFIPGLASRFRATGALLDLAKNHGISIEIISRHYLLTLPSIVIRLRASSSRNGVIKVRSRFINYERNQRTMEMTNRIRTINHYLAEQTLRGGQFNGYQRIFNEGDRADFNWNMGGRLYCQGKDSYQLMKKAERLKMTINGEPVAEIDINASFLTILHGMLEIPLPDKKDLYHVEGIPRDVVKAFITSTLGNVGFHKRWPSEINKSLREKGIETNRRYPIREVERMVCETLTIMTFWPKGIYRWSHLMFWESEQIISVMETLKEGYNIPAYSVHDSIIIPQSAVTIATQCLKDAYRRAFGIECRLKVNDKDNYASQNAI